MEETNSNFSVSKFSRLFIEKSGFFVFWLATEEQLSTLPVVQVNTHTQHNFHDLNKCWVLDMLSIYYY